MTNSTDVYQETLDYLYAQLPMYQRVGVVAFKKDLTNIRLLCDALGQPQHRFPSIHIAGTNGKGSVAHLLAGILQARGYKTGLYTSPHYRDFRERVKVDGKLMSRDYVVDFVRTHGELFERIQPSFFEITVAMAFDHFAREKVDVAVVEVGLGGRLDSTNVLLPVLSVITNISYDHTDMLGDTLALIAAEKAGIIKPEVPVVIGETHPETRPVFDRVATEKRAPIQYADQCYEAIAKKEGLTHTTYDVYRNGRLYFRELEVNVVGPYQHYNLQTALMAAEWLRKRFKLRKKEVRAGLADLRIRTRFTGRWQVLAENPTVLVDSAHNEGGLTLTVRRLRELAYDRLHVVLGFVKDKALDQLLALFPGNARYYFAKADVPRGLEASVLKEKAETFGLKGQAYASVPEALDAARRAASSKDLIFVGGSIFVVAEVIGEDD